MSKEGVGERGGDSLHERGGGGRGKLPHAIKAWGPG